VKASIPRMRGASGKGKRPKGHSTLKKQCDRVREGMKIEQTEETKEHSKSSSDSVREGKLSGICGNVRRNNIHSRS